MTCPLQTEQCEVRPAYCDLVTICSQLNLFFQDSTYQGDRFNGPSSQQHSQYLSQFSQVGQAPGHLSPLTCHLSPVTCHLSPVTCHMSPVTCHLSSSEPVPGPIHQGIPQVGQLGQHLGTGVKKYVLMPQYDTILVQYSGRWKKKQIL